MKSIVVMLAFVTLIVGRAAAAQVEARLSSREAYVGMPIVLQIAISNATKYQKPKIPEIDGCEVRAIGSPSQSSRVTIVNGRRSESTSVTMVYQITPRREGTFEIPTFDVDADGTTTTIPAQRFVVTKSVTGDLLFVEVEGDKDKVFVGQPLDLVLKIWIKPYRDKERNLTLSEEDMWNMVSEQTSWGSFAARMKDLAKNQQRPGGKEVLRNDGQGNERSYYLYQIHATVYPKRSGKIDADDVQIIVNYPTALGPSRSPLGSMFEDGPFGSHSPFADLMDDDFFGSTFGNRLTVTSARPVVGDVTLGSTVVVPVPTEGRPDDYRGAVGRYQIVSHATPTTVDAGDPITLNIGISGTGPMELVQAPPLSELASLVADFKVADQSLAGFVQDDAKVFSTTIRPRREGIAEVPAIRFSFFDPDTQRYQTVTSDPISITVNPSETLALDAIVGNSTGSSGTFDLKSATNPSFNPDFANDDSASVLVSQSPESLRPWWWMFAVAPAVAWLIVWLVRHRATFYECLPSLRSAQRRCLIAIASASDGTEIADALSQYVSRRSGQTCATMTHALGVLRVAGMAGIANELETHLGGSSPHRGSAVLHSKVSDRWTGEEQLASARAQASTLVDKIEASFAARAKLRVRSPRKRLDQPPLQRAAKRGLVVLLASALAVSATNSVAAQSIQLSTSQQSVVLREAAAAYAQATELATGDSADAKELFQTAARNYQLLVDSGIHNGQLYINLGNAYFQGGELGRAIANYEHASRFLPSVPQLAVNLKFAEAQVKGNASPTTKATTASLESFWQVLDNANSSLHQKVGSRATLCVLAVSSLLFWGMWIARTIGYKFPVWRFTILPAVLMIFSMASLWLAETRWRSPLAAVIVVNEVSLHAGDGEQFDLVASIDSAQGHRVEVILQRGAWTKIRTDNGASGWVPSQSIEPLSERS